MEAKNYEALFSSVSDFKSKEFRIRLANQFHSYILKDVPDDELCFYVYGCAGENNKAQRKVAAHMESTAATSPRKPVFFLEIGDNFYKNGVKKTDDKLFKENFVDVYQNSQFTNTKDTPTFLELGNHDYKKWGWALTENSDAIETYQVLYTYLLNNQFSPELLKQYFDFQLYLSKIRKYNMPSRNYTLFAKHAEIYMIDSNTLVSDWLRSQNGRAYVFKKFTSIYKQNAAKHYQDFEKKIAKQGDGENQFEALYSQFRKSDVTIKIAAMHHPIYYTADNREYDSDAELYLSKDEIAILNKIGLDGCYGDYIGKIFEIEKLNFDLALGAHVHGMYLYNDLQGKCQIVSGAGGANLQHHRNFAKIQNLPLFVREHGFVEVVVKNKQLSFYFHSVKKKMWAYTNVSREPIRIENENERLIYFRGIVLNAVEKYFEFLDREQQKTAGEFLKLFGNPSHGDKGVDRANELRNYLNLYTVDDLKTTIKTVFNIIKDSGDQQHSLRTKVNHDVYRAYALSLEELLVCNESAIMPKQSRSGALDFSLKSAPTFFKPQTDGGIPENKVLPNEKSSNLNYLLMD